MTNNNQQWPDVLQMFYGLSLSDPDAMDWMHELSRTKANNAEICSAIRAAADADLVPGQGKFYPTVTDLKHWVLRNRRATPLKTSVELTEVEFAFIKKWKPMFEGGAADLKDVQDAASRMPSSSFELIREAFYMATGVNFYTASVEIINHGDIYKGTAFEGILNRKGKDER